MFSIRNKGVNGAIEGVATSSTGRSNASSCWFALWLRNDKYPFHPTATAPPNSALNSNGTNQKLTAVTAGQSLHELMYAVGIVFFSVSIISRVLTVPIDANTLWRVKKAARKTGVKKIWFTSTRVDMESSFERKLKDSPRYLNLFHLSFIPRR